MNTLIQSWDFITTWYNFPFTFAILIFLGLLALQFVGLGHDHDADGDVDAHADIDLHAQADLDHNVDHDIDHDIDHNVDHDADHDVDHDVSGWAEILHFMGVGYVPVTMVLALALGSFGLLGWALNTLAFGVFAGYPNWAIFPAVLVSLAGSAWFTGRTSRLMGRLVPAFSSSATPMKRLVGLRGRVSSPQVDQTYGQVKVRDSGGTLITVFAVVDPGHAPIPADTEVFLVDYNPANKVFVVVPSDN